MASITIRPSPFGRGAFGRPGVLGTQLAYHVGRRAETRLLVWNHLLRVLAGQPGPLASVAMRALHSFTVRPRLPGSLEPLYELAMNLRWSWDSRTRDLFRWVEPEQWERSGGDPVAVLSRVSHERLDALTED